MLNNYGTNFFSASENDSVSSKVSLVLKDFNTTYLNTDILLLRHTFCILVNFRFWYYIIYVLIFIFNMQIFRKRLFGFR